MSFELVSAEPENDGFRYELTKEVKQNLDTAIVKIKEFVKERETWMPNMGIKKDSLQDEANGFINQAQRDLLSQHTRPGKYRKGDLRNIDDKAFMELIKNTYGEKGLATFSNVKKKPKKSWWSF